MIQSYFKHLPILLALVSLDASNGWSHMNRDSKNAVPQGHVRIKDIVDVSGIRNNQLVGYGLVVGLNGTGDNLSSSPFTRESLVSMLERLGINTRTDAASLKTKNVAAVMVTATLPPFARHGSQIDISISALGDAKSLLGGTLLVTPLLSADGEVYAVAQGSVTVGGFSAKGESGTSITKGVPTGARIANGAIVEREVSFSLASQKQLTLSLRNPDLTTANRVAEAINTYAHGTVAQSKDPTTIEISLASLGGRDPIQFLTDIEQLRVTPDQMAKVVIDEQNGVIVMGANVQISTVAISHGNLTIKITEADQVSQPNPLSSGTTERVNRSKVEVTEEGKKLGVLKNKTTLQELVKGLNALGIGPRDMITVLQAIKAAGALQADIEIMS